MAEPLAEDEGLELVDVEQTSAGRHRIIRVYLDKPGGVTLGDCARFSRRLSDCLDMNQTVPGSYHLEVSSPGLERPLRTLEHVARFVGQRAAFVTHEARDGRRKWDGVLLGPDEDRAGLRLDDGIEHWFDWTDVKSARLVVDPWAGLKQPGRKRSPESRPRGRAR